MAPANAFYLLQGVESLPVRMARHVENTRRIVAFLDANPAVDWVSYPELPSHPDRELAKRLLPKGCGAIFSFGIKGGREAGRRFIERLGLFSHLANVGDAKSLVHPHPASTTHQQMDAAALEAAGVGEDLVRLSVGMEDADDLIDDLAAALRASAEEPGGIGRARIMELTVNGKRVFGSTGGRDFDPALDPVIFLHGSGMDRTVWQLQNPLFRLARAQPCWRSTCPGHGKSEGPALDSIEVQAAWVADLLDAAGLARAALVGHSMGAALALETAAAYPDRGEAPSPCAGSPKTCRSIPNCWRRGLEGNGHAYDLITSWGFDRAAHIGGHKAPGVWMTGGGLRLLERGRDAVVGTDLAASNDYRGAAAAAARIACPVLFVLGDRDKMTPPPQRPAAD